MGRRFEIEPHAKRGNYVVIVNEDEAESFGIYVDDELLEEDFPTRRAAELALAAHLIKG